jgi:hypothetical protein
MRSKKMETIDMISRRHPNQDDPSEGFAPMEQGDDG